MGLMTRHSDVLLVALSDAEFVDYRRHVIQEYAEESAAAGRIPRAGALQWAERETDKLLPEGRRTKDAYIHKIVSESQPDLTLGYLWSARDASNPDNAFIYDVQVLPAHRGRGIATAALGQLHHFLRERGYKEVALHVYHANAIAQALYDRRGYKPISHVLRKDLLHGDA